MRNSGVLYLLLGLLHATAAGQLPQLREAYTWTSPTILRGGASDPSAPGRFFTWGETVQRWDNGQPREIARSPQGFDDGGCAVDLDGDQRTDLVLARRAPAGPLGDLVALRAPSFTPELIDTNVELHDCRPATLFHRRGFLMIHRHAQVRFYWRTGAGKWAVEEVYSIYTASRQSGLALADVDGDKRTDIYAGNYWVRSPERTQLPWHIFAIHLHNETDDAASFSYAAWPGLLAGAQRDRVNTPIRLFTRPPDPRQLWPETELPGVRLNHPRVALAWTDWAIFGHDAGLLLADPRSGQHRSFPSPAVLTLWESAGQLYSLSERRITLWSPAGTGRSR